MFKQGKYGQASQSIFISSAKGLANILALIAAVLGSPWVFGKTIDWVQRLIAASYGTGFEGITAVVWFGLCAGLVFFSARMSISTALVMAAISLATRFL